MFFRESGRTKRMGFHTAGKWSEGTSVKNRERDEDVELPGLDRQENFSRCSQRMRAFEDGRKYPGNSFHPSFPPYSANPQ